MHARKDNGEALVVCGSCGWHCGMSYQHTCDDGCGVPEERQIPPHHFIIHQLRFLTIRGLHFNPPPASPHHSSPLAYPCPRDAGDPSRRATRIARRAPPCTSLCLPPSNSPLHPPSPISVTNARLGLRIAHVAILAFVAAIFSYFTFLFHFTWLSTAVAWAFAVSTMSASALLTTPNHQPRTDHSSRGETARRTAECGQAAPEGARMGERARPRSRWCANGKSSSTDCRRHQSTQALTSDLVCLGARSGRHVRVDGQLACSQSFSSPSRALRRCDRRLATRGDSRSSCCPASEPT